MPDIPAHVLCESARYAGAVRVETSIAKDNATAICYLCESFLSPFKADDSAFSQLAGEDLIRKCVQRTILPKVAYVNVGALILQMHRKQLNYLAMCSLCSEPPLIALVEVGGATSVGRVVGAQIIIIGRWHTFCAHYCTITEQLLCAPRRCVAIQFNLNDQT